MSSEEDEKPGARQITFSLEDGTVLWEGTAETFGPRPFVQLADEAGKKYIFKRINREAFAFLSKGGAGEIKALTLATIDTSLRLASGTGVKQAEGADDP